MFLMRPAIVIFVGWFNRSLQHISNIKIFS